LRVKPAMTVVGATLLQHLQDISQIGMTCPAFVPVSSTGQAPQVRDDRLELQDGN